MTFDIIVPASTLQDFVDTFNSIVDEASLLFDEASVYAEPVDPANVAMCAQRLHADECEHYHSDGVKIGLNLQRFDDYLSKADSDDLVNLTFDAEKRRVDIEYGDVSVSMAGIDPETIRNGQTLPEDAIAEMSTDVTMDGAALSHAVDVAGMVSDHVLFDSDPNRDEPLHVVGEGDVDDARVEFSSALHEGSQIPEKCESLFNREYLKEITGAIPKAADVRLQHGDEFPMRITYEYPDAHVDVEFGLAPRIDSS